MWTRNNLNPDDKVILFGLLSIASQIKQYGIPVNLIDSRFYTKQEIVKKIDSLSDKVKIIGFSIMTAHILHAFQLSKYIKSKYPDKYILWGGIHPTLFPRQTIEHPSVDFIICGEGEESVIALIKNIYEKKGSFSDIPGLGYKKMTK